jgi:hypothetical protein
VDTKFPAGGTNTFTLTCKRYNPQTQESTAQDISAATEVIVYLATRSEPTATLASVTCSSGFSGADWANGIVTGAFDDSDTSTITDYGFANLVIKVTVGGEPEYFYSDDKAVKIVSVPG